MPRTKIRFLFIVVSVVFISLSSTQPGNSQAPDTQSSRPPLTGAVRIWNGKPTLFVNGQPTYPMIYSLTSLVGARYTWEEIPHIGISDFNQAGISLFSFSLYLDQFFDKDDNLDLSLLTHEIRSVLDVNPKAGIFFYLLVLPSPEWRAAHPEENIEYADTKAVDFHDYNVHTMWMDHDADNSVRTSLASMKWRASVVKRLGILLPALARTPEGKALVALQVSIGIYGEAHYWGFVDHEPDTGPAMTAYFRTWLREKYRTDQALQAAWNDPAATLANAQVPGTAEREHTSDGIFRDPARERQVIDYYQCQHQVVADDILLFCKTAKESWPRPLVVGTLYSYFFCLFGRQVTGGHLDSERVLSSPYIDYFRAPMSYTDLARNVGGSGQSRGVLDHVHSHGKLWLDEMDYNTAFGDPFYNLSRNTTSFADDIALLRRNLSQSFTHGTGLFFWDFGPRSVGGAWHHPDLLATIRQMHDVLSSYYTRPFRRDSDVLFVYDNLVHYYLANSWKREPITEAAIERASAAAYHTGVVFDETMLADLETIDWSRYKVVLFMDTYYLTDRQRQFIREHVERDGRQVVWNFMPGYTNGDVLNQNFVEEVTGMKLEKFTPPPGEPAVVVKADSLPPARFSVAFSVPMMAVADPEAEWLGYLSDVRHCGLARKRVGDSTVWYSSLPITDAALMRAIFRAAGAYIYDNQPDVLYSGGGILTVHSLDGGPRSLHLLNGKEVSVDLQPRSTIILDSDTGEVLIGN